MRTIEYFCDLKLIILITYYSNFTSLLYYIRKFRSTMVGFKHVYNTR